MEDLERRFTEWASSRPDVRAALVVGSRARDASPADQWSDLDVVVFALDPSELIDHAEWVDELGDVRTTFAEQTEFGGHWERRALYADGADVDFTVLPARLASEPGDLIQSFANVAGRGSRVLLDKDGALSRLLDRLPPPEEPEPPSSGAFAELVNDFWYHAVWTARKLRRGEVFTAKGSSDEHMKRLLLRLLEWHAHARGVADTWHEGRFLERWADPETLERLRTAYSLYDLRTCAAASSRRWGSSGTSRSKPPACSATPIRRGPTSTPRRSSPNCFVKRMGAGDPGPRFRLPALKW